MLSTKCWQSDTRLSHSVLGDRLVSEPGAEWELDAETRFRSPLEWYVRVELGAEIESWSARFH